MKRRLSCAVMAAIAVAPLLASCGGETKLPPAAVNCGQGTSTIGGQILAPNGTTPVAGALIETSGFTCSATADGQGRFTLEGVPEGPIAVTAKKGVLRVAATIASGTTAQMKIDPSSIRLAHFIGTFDRIQEVATNLGFTSTELDSEDDLLAEDFASTYQVLLLNCGMFDHMLEKPEVREALTAFAEQGGAIYASDWSETFVEASFPGRITFRTPSRVGAVTGGPVTVQIVDPSLAAALGRDTAQIGFDASQWAMMEKVSAGGEVLVRGKVADESGVRLDLPLAVRFPVGEGRVTFTSFHHELTATNDTIRLIEQMLFGL